MKNPASGTHLDLTLAFLGSLKNHNNREWFAAQSERYDTARAAFEDFVDDLIIRYNEIEPVHGLPAKDCVYRIHRDVRFSSDKTPYKTSMSAVIGPGGRRSQRLNLYVHIEPGASMAASGLYMPTPEQLKRVRASIDEDDWSLRSVLSARDFKKHFGALGGERLKSSPRGYAADHPAADLLSHKQFLAMKMFSDADVTSPKFAEKVMTAARAMRPFNQHFNELLGL